MIETNIALATEYYIEKNQVRFIDETKLIDSLTHKLIEAISVIELADIAAQTNQIDEIEEQHCKLIGSRQIELIFAQVRDLIQINELQPRFLAALDRSYRLETGRALKTDLGGNSHEYERSFQLAIDVASSQSLPPL